MSNSVIVSHGHMRGKVVLYHEGWNASEQMWTITDRQILILLKLISFCRKKLSAEVVKCESWANVDDPMTCVERAFSKQEITKGKMQMTVKFQTTIVKMISNEKKHMRHLRSLNQTKKWNKIYGSSLWKLQ